MTRRQASDLLNILQIIVANAELHPDPRMNGATDCYLVSLDDIEAAREVIRKAEGDRPRDDGTAVDPDGEPRA